METGEVSLKGKISKIIFESSDQEFTVAHLKTQEGAISIDGPLFWHSD